MRTSLGIFAERIWGEIPIYINKILKDEIKILPKPKDGKDGVSVVNSYIAADGSLVLVLSNGTEIDAGDIGKSASGYQINTQLANEQIIVSTTAPTNPQLNQLWYDIS